VVRDATLRRGEQARGEAHGGRPASAAVRSTSCSEAWVAGAAPGAAVGATAGAGAGAIRPSTAQRQVRGSGDSLAQAAGHRRSRLRSLLPSRCTAHCQASHATDALFASSAAASADAPAPATAAPSVSPSAAASASASLPQLEHVVGYRGAVVTPSAAASAAACPGWRAHPLALRRGSYIIPLAALVG
jgi:hypothetical protein